MNAIVNSLRGLIGSADDRDEPRAVRLRRELGAITEPATWSEMSIAAWRKRQLADGLAATRGPFDPERKAAEDAADAAEAETAAYREKHAKRFAESDRLARELTEAVQEVRRATLARFAALLTPAERAERDAAVATLQRLLLEECARWEAARQMQAEHGLALSLGNQPRPTLQIAHSANDVARRAAELRAESAA